MSAFAVRRAAADDAPRIAPLFDAYRVFYGQRADVETAQAFLAARIERDESTVFFADDEAGNILGFVQLYPVFSSTTTPPGKIWLLNDLYVVDRARKRGIGRALLERAERLAVDTQALGITLSTATDNLRAQRLYEAMNYRRDTVFFVYNRTLP